MATHTPARCKTCGHLFEAPNLIGGHGGTVTLKGNITNCPKCGRDAEILDGTYELMDNQLSLVSGPQRTVELLQTLQAIIEQDRAKGVAPEETLKKVQAQADKTTLARALSLFRDPGTAGAAGVLQTIIAVAALVYAMKGAPVSDEDIARIAKRVVAEQVEKAVAPVQQQLADAKVEGDRGEAPKRIPKPHDRKGKYKAREKRR